MKTWKLSAVSSGLFGLAAAMGYAAYFGTPLPDRLTQMHAEAAQVAQYIGSRPADELEKAVEELEAFRVANPGHDAEVLRLEGELQAARISVRDYRESADYAGLMTQMSADLEKYADTFDRDPKKLLSPSLNLGCSLLWGLTALDRKRKQG